MVVSTASDTLSAQVSSRMRAPTRTHDPRCLGARVEASPVTATQILHPRSPAGPYVGSTSTAQLSMPIEIGCCNLTTA